VCVCVCLFVSIKASEPIFNLKRKFPEKNAAAERLANFDGVFLFSFCNQEVEIWFFPSFALSIIYTLKKERRPQA
jgi:hypothetical protein